MKDFSVEPGGSLTGHFSVPGDKSISHRSIMFGALAEGVTHISGFLEGEDALATLNSFKAMGVNIEGPENGKVIVHGVGMHGLQKPDSALDLGNSGTSMRLMAGLLAGHGMDVELIGDESLSGRPMKRVTEPLASMGAQIDATEKGTAPLRIKAACPLNGLDYQSPVASAQVKSCLLLAGMYAQGETCVTEPGVSRDHTERMLRAFGYDVKVEGRRVCLQGGGKLKAIDIQVPADISSAAFFMVGALIAEGSDITLEAVGINPTRTGVIDILKLMGANLQLLNERKLGDEPVADIRIQASALKGIDIPEALVPLAIDEFPAIFIAAACASGVTRLTGAEELRVKESDRIQSMADGLNILGIDAEATADGIIIQGGRIQGGCVESRHDHRIAMSFAMAGLVAEGRIQIKGVDNVATSFPDFVGLARRAGLNISES